MLALGMTSVDFFSLDIEGAEPLIINTIPFDKVDIKVKILKIFDNFSYGFLWAWEWFKIRVSDS